MNDAGDASNGAEDTGGASDSAGAGDSGGTDDTGWVEVGDWPFEELPDHATSDPDFDVPTAPSSGDAEVPWLVDSAVRGSPTGGEPLCRGEDDVTDHRASFEDARAGIWGDGSGLYVRTVDRRDRTDTQQLLRHRGDEWVLVAEFAGRYPEADLVAAGDRFVFAGPGLPAQDIDRYTGEVSVPEGAVMSQFVVESAEEDRVWADGAAYHDGSEWHVSDFPEYTLMGVETMWAGSDQLVMAGQYGSFAIFDDGEWRLSAFPTIDSILAVGKLDGVFYAMTSKAVWAMEAPDEWREVGEFPYDCDASGDSFRSLEPAGDRLIAANQQGLFQVTPSGVETLVEFAPGGDCERNDIELVDAHNVPGLGTAMVVRGIEPTACADYILIWDGTELRWL